MLGLGSLETCPGVVGANEGGPSQFGPTEVGALQRTVPIAAVFQFGLDEARTSQAARAEVRAGKPRPAQIDEVQVVACEVQVIALQTSTSAAVAVKPAAMIKNHSHKRLGDFPESI